VLLFSVHSDRTLIRPIHFFCVVTSDEIKALWFHFKAISSSEAHDMLVSKRCDSEPAL
jgi:hypothetical protein